MSYKPQRLSKLAKEFNVGVDTILEFLGPTAEGLNRNSKIEADVHELLVKEYQPDMIVKAEAKQQKEAKQAEEEAKKAAEEEVETVKVSAPKIEFKVVDKLELNKEEVVVTNEEDPENEKIELREEKSNTEKSSSEEKEEPKEESPGSTSIIRAKAGKLDGPKILEGQKIDLAQFKSKKKKPVASSSIEDTKKKRKRIIKKVDPRKAARKNRGKK